MTTRHTDNARARKRLGDKRLLAFLKHVHQRPGEPLACQLFHEALERGETLEALFNGPGESGFFVETRRTGGGWWRINFGYVAGPMTGDGVDQEVKFNRAGEVEETGSVSCWIS